MIGSDVPSSKPGEDKRHISATAQEATANRHTNDLPHPVPAHDYDTGYYDLYYPPEGRLREEINLRVGKGLDMARVTPGTQLLDIGCGPGDFLIACARTGALSWGIDYSHDAVAVARKSINVIGPELRRMISIEAMDAKDLAFGDGSFDVVTMMDVVEHLYPHELNQALSEAARVLKRPGRLVIRTMPNAWISRPAYRFAAMLARRTMPWDSEHFHVNEQSPVSLVRSLRRLGGEQRLIMGKVSDKYFASHLPREGSPLLRLIAKVIDRVVDSPVGCAFVYGTPLRYVLGTELWATVDL